MLNEQTAFLQGTPSSGEGRFRHLNEWALPLLAVSLSFGHQANTFGIVLLLVSEVLNFQKSRWLKNSRCWFILPVVFYALHVVGMSYSSNTTFGWFDIQVKSGLLLLPLCILAHGTLSLEQWNRFFRGFLLGLLLACIACLIPAIHTWTISGSYHGFFYQEFSRYLHPSYFAWYADTAVLLLWLNRSDPLLKGSLRFVLLIIFSLIVFLCNSKAGLAGWVFVTLFGSIASAVEQRALRPLLLGVIHAALLAGMAWKVVPPSENRVQAMQDNLSEDTLAKDDPRSTAIRLHVWAAAGSLIRESPLWGYGTGDVKDVLIRRYAEHGLTPAVEKKLNAHNQFLQSWVALGLPGFLLLLLMLPVSSWRFRKGIAFSGFLLLTTFNFLVESMLETQSGVAFYALFYSVFLNRQSAQVSYEDSQPGGRSSPVH